MVDVNLHLKNVVSLEEAKILKANGYKGPSYMWYIDHSSEDVPAAVRIFCPSELNFDFNNKRKNHNKYDSWIYTAPLKTDKKVIEILSNKLEDL